MPMVLRAVFSWRWLVLPGLIRSGRLVGLGQFVSFGRFVRSDNLHRRTGLKFVLPIDDDLFTFLQAAINQGLSSINLGDLHGAHFSGFILCNHVSVRSIWATLNTRRRDDYPVASGGNQKPVIDELTGP